MVVDICENEKKSTALHLKLLAPASTNLHIKPFRQEGIDSSLFDFVPEMTLILFPTKDSLNINDVSLDSFDRLIVIDGTW
jgi:hypothetical protein